MNTVRTHFAVIADKIGLVLTVLICAALLAAGALNGASAAPAGATLPIKAGSSSVETGGAIAIPASYNAAGEGGALAQD